MSVIFEQTSKTFYLDGKGISYIFRINEVGYAEHLYYGASIPHEDISSLFVPGTKAFSVSVPGEDLKRTFFQMPSELTFFGTGDYREPAVEVVYPNGSRALDLRYCGHEILSEKPRITGMPSMRGGETLVLHLCDPYADFACDLYYTIYEDCAIIARRAVYRNTGDLAVRLNRAYSFAMSLPNNDYTILSLYGAWAKERQVEKTPLHHGVFSVDSKRTSTSATLHPFLAVAEPNTTETQGNVWGVSLVYSSSFVLKAEGDATGYALLTGGINDFDFSWKLESGESFETPEVLLAFSANGYGDMSRAYHDALREYLINPRYVKQPRPVVINNWEATYFDFTAEKLEEIMQSVAGTGIDTFVLDDGWFGIRNNDATSLGDWVVNENKLVGGLDRVIKSANDLGLKFGLWFEPEMVSEDSDLFRKHPDYAIGIPNRPRCYSRHQYILDLTRADVRDQIVASINGILKKHHIEYVKWDSNRNVTDSFSLGLPADRQGEFAHRYALGLYDICERIVNANPNIFFEGCSGGGARFDPAMLYFFPQIWTSDDSDAEERTKIQYGTSMAYPTSAMSCHVSAVPNHQTGRVTPLQSRADIAQLGATGYELDTSKMTAEELEEVKAQVAEFRAEEELVLSGDLYRIADPFETNQFGMMLVSKDKEKATVTIYRRMASANTESHNIRLNGLDGKKRYFIRELDTAFSGEVLMKFGLPPIKGSGDFRTMKYHLCAEK